jgi:hypothetical protein
MDVENIMEANNSVETASVVYWSEFTATEPEVLV